MHTDRITRGGFAVADDPAHAIPILMRPMRISSEPFTHRGILCITRGPTEP
jgi:hypothetical protein